jgi:hypothetical protein
VTRSCLASCNGLFTQTIEIITQTIDMRWVSARKEAGMDHAKTCSRLRKRAQPQEERKPKRMNTLELNALMGNKIQETTQ